MSRAPGSDAVIPLSTTNLDGATGDDYSGVPASLTFGPTDMEKTFTFTAADDAEDDDGESVKLSFDSPLPDGVTAGTTPETTVSITDNDDPAVEVSFEHSTYEVMEGGGVTVKVKLNAEPERTVDITLIPANQGGAGSDDYSLSATTLTFGPTDMEKTFTFTAADDAEDDDGESVKLSFDSPLPDGVSAGTTHETTVSITDDDVPAVEVSFEQSTYTVAEGSGVTVKVKLNAEPERTVDITLILTNQGASDADYSGVPASLMFGPTDTEKTFTFTAADDAEDDDGESVKLSFGSALPAGVSRGSVPETTVSINDDDVPSVTVSFDSATYPVDEGDTVTVTVTLSAAPEREVVVPIDTTDEDGASSADYSLSETSVTFGLTDIEKTFTFTATQDSVDDDGESVDLTFGSALPAGVSRGSVPETTVSINDDDMPAVEVSFELATYTVSEGSGVTVKVKLNAEPERPVDIPLILTNQGASDDDYSGVPTSVTFGLTETSKTFTFTATQDSVDDDGESVKLSFGSALPAGVSRGSVPETTVSINDDDVPSSLTVNFGASTYNVTEGSTVEVVLTLDDDPEREVIIPFSKTNQGGASDSDYVVVPTSVIFNAGEISKSFEFSAASDRIGDPGEKVSFKLENLPQGTTAGTTSETVVTIGDVEPQGSTTVSFGADTYGVSEGSSTTITVVMSHAPGSDAIIPIEIEDEEGAGSADYSGVPASLTTETSKTFTFTATQDSVDDDGESVKFTFGSALPAGVSRGSVPETTVSINDDDDPAVEVSFEHSTYNVAESDDASTVDKRENEVTVKVTLSAEPERTVDITLIPANQGGAGSDDYSLSATSVTFGPTDTEKTFTFTAADDADDDDGESVKLTFGSPLPDGVSAGTTHETTVSITDDDVPAVEVSFEHSTYTVAEGSGVTVKVKLNAEPERPVDITLILTNQGASGDDYSGVPASLMFGPTDTEKTFTFTAADDAEDDDGESVKLSFDSPLPDGVSAGTTPETTVSITDDDVPAVAVSFELATYTVAEGSGVTVKVKLNAEPERPVDITLILTNQGGAGSDDYSLSATTLTFGPTDMEKTFTFTAADDAEDDDGESVKLSFDSPLPDGVTAGTTPETTVSITDDDDPAVEVSFEHSTYEVMEGGGVTVKVKLNAEPERTVDITLIPANQGASDADYSGVPASLMFGPTDTEKTFTFTATQDSVDDDGESVKLSFDSPLPDGVTAGTTPETTVSITDDDDPAVEVSFEHSSYTVAEGSGVTVKVKLNAEPERTVDITLILTNQGASDVDYSGVPASLMFGPTDTEKTFTFTAADDAEDDDGESVKLSFGSVLPDGVSQGTPTETVVSIIDDETVMEVSFEESSYSVEEGHGVEVVVKLDPAPDHQMDIQLQKTNVNGTSDDDYSGIPSMLTFETGETEKTFTFFAELDDENDDHEAVEVSFVALPAMVRKGDPSKAMVTVRDNGGPSQGGVTCIDNTGARRNDPQGRAAIVTVLSERGVISSPGEIDTWIIPGVDPHRTYLVEILGADSSVDVWGQDVGGGLTLADPHPVSLYHEAGNPGGHGFNSAPGDFGTGRNSRLIFIFSTYGDFVLKVKSGESADDQGTGSYHLLVRYDNYCVVRDDDSIVFPFEGGPEGYAQDIRDDTDTRFQVYDRNGYDGQRTHYFGSGHILGDNWGSEPDEDWFRFELEGDSKYEVYLEGSSRFPVEHRLTRPRIVGIFDENGGLFHEGAAGSGNDTSVSLTFQTTSGGHYYLGVGSNPGDQTGVYSFNVRRTESSNAGHASTNNSPTGGPGITGLPTIGEVLTATVSGIDDADGLQNASFSYQWVRHDPVTNTDTDIPGATGSTYTVTRQDRDRAIKVRVEFTDDGGNNEELTSFALLILPPVNTPASGQPAIAGTLEVGQVLTADTSGISDADGMHNATFGYQWTAGGSQIQNAIGMSHTLTEDEEGLAIRVSVSFTDDAGNEETLTSQATMEVASGGPTEPPGHPRNLTGVANADGTVTLRWKAPDDDSVTGYQILRRRPTEGENTLLVYVEDTGSAATTYTDANVSAGIKHVYRVQAINAAGLSKRSNAVRITPTQPDEPENSPATGGPTISGMPQVGETLRVDTSGIGDADGLTNASYIYQWVVTDGGADVDIHEATGASYTPVAADRGLSILVRVSFTDDAGNEETLTSMVTDVMAAAP